MRVEEFLTQAPRHLPCRYILSGDNAFLKDYILRCISKSEKRKLKYMTAYTPDISLFGSEYISVIKPPKGTKKPLIDSNYVVYLKNNAPAKCGNLKYEVVECGALFPSGTVTVTKHMLSTYKLSLDYANELALRHQYDLAAVYNSVQLLRYSTNLEVIEDDQHDMSKIVNYFVDGDLPRFFSGALNTEVNISEFIYYFLGTLTSAMKLRYTKHYSPWYQNRMNKMDSCLRKPNLEQIIIYLTSVCSQYVNNPSTLRLHLCKAVLGDSIGR